MNFKSKSFKQEGDQFVLIGMLSIKGISREETFIVKPVGAVKNESGKTFAYFTTEKMIDRSTYGLRSGFSVSNDVNIRLDILLTRNNVN
jgi:polyisoprenoid-binding protein YceI